MNALLSLVLCLCAHGVSPAPQEGNPPVAVSALANGWGQYRFEAGFAVELPALPKADEAPWGEAFMKAVSDWQSYRVGGQTATVQILAQRFWEPIPLTVRQIARSFAQGYRQAPGMDDTSYVLEPAEIKDAKAVVVTLYSFLPDGVVQTKALIVVRERLALTLACTYPMEGRGKAVRIFERMMSTLTLD